MKNGLKRLVGNSRGATAIEYGLILSFIVLAMMGALIFLADTTVGLWNDVSDNVAQ